MFSFKLFSFLSSLLLSSSFSFILFSSVFLISLISTSFSLIFFSSLLLFILLISLISTSFSLILFSSLLIPLLLSSMISLFSLWEDSSFFDSISSILFCFNNLLLLLFNLIKEFISLSIVGIYPVSA